jgi:hypothetical protein
MLAGLEVQSIRTAYGSMHAARYHAQESAAVDAHSGALYPRGRVSGALVAHRVVVVRASQ